MANNEASCKKSDEIQNPTSKKIVKELEMAKTSLGGYGVIVIGSGFNPTV